MKLPFQFPSIFTSSSATKRPPITPMKEMGATGANIVGGYIVDREKNHKLTYLQRSTSYENIMANIAVVGSGVRYFTALGASAVWSVEAAEGDDSDEYTELVERMMTTVDQSWSTIIKHALMHRYIGFSVQEWTAFRDEDGMILFKSIENRPQRTIKQFDVADSGEVLGFGQEVPATGQNLYIPRKKTLYLVDNLIDDSPAGMGVLRHVFESCERLRDYLKLEQQGYEKDLRGIPIGRVPYAELNQAVQNGEITQEQAKSAISAMENLVRSSRKLPDTGITLDSKNYVSRADNGVAVTANRQWDLELLQGVSPGLQEINNAIERVQKEIARVLSSEAQMLDGAGSNALSKDKSTNAYLAVNATLHDVCEQVNKDLITPLWELNGLPKEKKPKLKVEDVSAKDAESVAVVLKDMATAGATLAPDDPAINDLREMLGISQVDLEAAAEMMAMEQERSDAQFEMDAEQAAANVEATRAKAKEKPSVGKK